MRSPLITFPCLFLLSFLAATTEPDNLDHRFTDSGIDELVCNRMEDGSLLDEARIGVVHDTTDCPEMP